MRQRKIVRETEKTETEREKKKLRNGQNAAYTESNFNLNRISSQHNACVQRFFNYTLDNLKLGFNPASN